MPAAGLPRGMVFLVGARPGDAGLITWRGVECLRQADWVLYDYLVNPAILRHVSRECRLLCLGRHRRSEVGGRKSEESDQAVSRRIWTQAEINSRLVDLARAVRGSCG